MKRYSVVVLAFLVGCATVGVERRPTSVSALSELAGNWEGWVRYTSGGSAPVWFTIKPEGRFEWRRGQRGTLIGAGRVWVNDGKGWYEGEPEYGGSYGAITLFVTGEGKRSIDLERLRWIRGEKYWATLDEVRQ